MRSRYIHLLIVKAGTLLSLCLMCFNGFTQEGTVKVNGYLIDEETQKKLTDVLVVNKKTGELIYGEEKGDFSFIIKKNDVLILSAQGYASLLFSLRDSVLKETYFIAPKLSRYKVFIAPVQITAVRELDEIAAELKRVHIESTFSWTDNYSPYNNAISFLYFKNNKREQSKRKTARLKNEAHKRILFKELFRKYMRYDSTLALSPKELDLFIESMNVYDDSINYSSKYDLLVYIKKTFLEWKDSLPKTE